MYANTPFTIQSVHCNKQFQNTIDILHESHNFEDNFSNLIKHIPAAEQNNRIICDRCRSIYYNQYDNVHRFIDYSKTKFLPQ